MGRLNTRGWRRRGRRSSANAGPLRRHRRNLPAPHLQLMRGSRASRSTPAPAFTVADEAACKVLLATILLRAMASRPAGAGNALETATGNMYRP